MSEAPKHSEEMDDFKPGQWDPAFSGFETGLPEGSWERLQQRRRKRRLLPFWWWTFGAMGLLLVSVGIWKFPLGPASQNETVLEQPVPAQKGNSAPPSSPTAAEKNESISPNSTKSNIERQPELAAAEVQKEDEESDENRVDFKSPNVKKAKRDRAVNHSDSRDSEGNGLLASSLPARVPVRKRKSGPEQIPSSRIKTSNQESPLPIQGVGLENSTQAPNVESQEALTLQPSSSSRYAKTEIRPATSDNDSQAIARSSKPESLDPSKSILPESPKPDSLRPVQTKNPPADSSQVAQKDSSMPVEKKFRFALEAGVLGFSLNQQFQDNPGRATDKSRTSLQSVDPGLGLSLQCRGVLNLGNRWQLVPALQLGAALIRSEWQTKPGPQADVRLIQVGNEIQGTPREQEVRIRRTRTLAFAGLGMEIGYRFTNRFTARTGLQHAFWLPVSDGDTKPEESLPSVLLAFHYQLGRRFSVRSEAVWGKGKRFLPELDATTQNLRLGLGVSATF